MIYYFELLYFILSRFLLLLFRYKENFSFSFYSIEEEETLFLFKTQILYTQVQDNLNLETILVLKFNIIMASTVKDSTWFLSFFIVKIIPQEFIKSIHVKKTRKFI